MVGGGGGDWMIAQSLCISVCILGDAQGRAGRVDTARRHGPPVGPKILPDWIREIAEAGSAGAGIKRDICYTIGT